MWPNQYIATFHEAGDDKTYLASILAFSWQEALDAANHEATFGPVNKSKLVSITVRLDR